MRTQIKFGQSWQLGIAVLLTVVGVVAQVGRTEAQSQVVPDNTLGTEGSVVTPNVEINDLNSARIDGGAIKGTNLFHSFQDFNVGEGKGVYFTNPQGIENILGRVTGANRSEILGTLGVLGNANLFLLNPNGIIFGKNASLDVQGSFFATTAEAIALGKQGYFSATKPQQSSLLSVSPGALFFNQAASQQGNIINRGNLSAGKDLTLAGGNLDLQGQLYAGENLTLQATDTLKIRDTQASPFLARSGGNLAIVGNQALDIQALNHPTQTSFVSGGNLSLISDGMISGDARFSSGGNFSIENLSGGVANFVSLYDPIISSNGDVDVAANYTGASLLVESKGNIRFGGDINITSPDTSALPAGQDSATLSKSTALIMRSGQNTLAYGGVSDGSVPALNSGTVPEGITISGDVSLQPFNGAGGVVSLTTASGDVSTKGITTNGGAIDINSAGASATTGNLNSSLQSESGSAENGGAIALTAFGNITTGNLESYSYSRSGSVGNGGAISLKAENGSITTGNLYSLSNSRSGNAGDGGVINLQANNGKITTGDLLSFSFSPVDSAADGGAITFTANGNITTGVINSEAGGTGKSGDITLTSNAGAIDTTKGTITSQIRDNSNGTGRAGTIVFTAKDNIQTALLNASAEKGDGGNIQLTSTNGAINTTRGTLATDSQSGNSGEIALNSLGNITTAILTSEAVGTTGNGGDISLKSRNGGINTTDELKANTRPSNSRNGGKITLQAEGDITTKGMRSDGGEFGISGDITITSNTGTILVNGGKINSENYGTLKGGDINITATAGSIFLRNDAELNASTQGQGNAGSVNIFARDTVSFDRSGAASTSTEINSPGKGGDINIIATAGSIFLSNGARLNASTQGKGDAGSVNMFARDTVSFNSSGASTETNSTGNGGSINITTTGSLSLTNGAALVINTSGEGNAGSINVKAKQLELSSNAALIGDVNKDAKGRGGDINLNVAGKILLRGGEQVDTGESTRITIGVLPGGIGSGGTLKIEAGSLVLTDGAIIKNSTQGQGDAGNINVKADTVDISGSVSSSGLPSGLFTSTDTDRSAGEIVVDTGTFRIADGAALSARSKGDGQGGKIEVKATSFEAVNGGQLVTTTFGRGQAGNIKVNATDKVTISGSDPNYTNRIARFPNPIDQRVANAIRETGPNSGLFANTETNSTGNGGEIRIDTSNFNLTDSAQISTSTSGRGRGGNLFVRAPQAATISGNGQLSVETSGAGAGGNLNIDTQRLTIQDGAQVSASTSSTNPNGKGGDITVNATQSLDLSNEASLLAQSTGAAPAGNIRIRTRNLTARNGSKARNDSIKTSSNQSSGGDITISRDITKDGAPIRADKIRLYGDSDITTSVGSGTGNGGKITLAADSIIAFEDSDILAYAQDGTGGNIEFKTPAFFGQNYKPAPADTAPSTLDGNDRVDVNASGVVSGVITLPDTSFIQNSLSELPENLIDTSTLIANSCIARSSQQPQGSFKITGSGGLPTRPGDALMSTYTFGNVRSVSNANNSANSTRRPWRKGDPIVEPQGVYRLSSGQLVLSRECP